MRNSPGFVLGLVTAALPVAAFGFTATEHSDHKSNALETASGAETRAQPNVSWTTPPSAGQAWGSFVQAHGENWRVLWDSNTRVPKRILGEGISAPASSLSPDAAKAAAIQLISQHLHLLAPGTLVSDYELVANDFDPTSGLRTVGFAQRYRGMRVLGGQLSVRIKNNRVIVLASEAKPNIDAPAVRKTVDALKAADLAMAWIKADASEVSLRQGIGEAFILPVPLAAGPTTYHTVVEVVVDARQPVGRWSVYLDAANGTPIAKRQSLMFANGTVQVNAPERRPGSTRLDWAAPAMSVSVNGQNATTGPQGQLTWTGDAPATLVLSAKGPQVNVLSDAGPETTLNATLEPGGAVTWDVRDEEFVDAQLNAFIAGSLVKSYAKVIAPQMRWLNTALQATVNIDDECNAFSDGTTINFFRAGRRCENTGRLADVVYHEFGHSFHAHAIIRGVGDFDTALSEGGADYLSATITNDNGMGRGFFFSNAPLRDVDEARDRVWPTDANDEPHQVGLIFAGAMWDLRKSLISGGAFASDADAVAHTDQLWYAALQRAGDIPSTYAEVLAADDDDGNLDNGTPNICAINAAFARHGLADENAIGPPISNPVLLGSELTVPVGASPSDCPGVSISGMNVIWQLRDQTSTQGSIVLSSMEGGYTAAIPEQAPGSVVQYRVEVSLDDGSLLRLPRNPADIYYEYYVGETVELYCTNFEADPEQENWLHALLAGENREGADDWTWGEPMATGDSGDPSRAFSGISVIGNDLGGGNFNGKYQSGKKNILYSPTIDTQRFPVVRLQYRRWLNVEDGDFDRATITSHGREVWSNRASGSGEGTTHHTDKEWRFHDVDLSQTVENGNVQVSFLIESDGGLEFGGWTIDDFCVVGYLPEGQNICGNGTIEGTEVCDDGNLADGDGCESSCTFTPGMAACGDGNVDPGEACDDGNVTDGDGCEASCVLSPTAMPDCTTDPSLCEDPTTNPTLEQLNETDGGCGCTANHPTADGLPAGFAPFALMGLFLARRRRQ